MHNGDTSRLKVDITVEERVKIKESTLIQSMWEQRVDLEFGSTTKALQTGIVRDSLASGEKTHITPQQAQTPSEKN